MDDSTPDTILLAEIQFDRNVPARTTGRSGIVRIPALHHRIQIIISFGEHMPKKGLASDSSSHAIPNRFGSGVHGTLNHVLACAETEWATKAGLGVGDNNLPFGSLCSIARAVSRLLMENGVKSGDRIALISREPLECLTIFWGVTLLGAICVPLDPASGYVTLSYILEQCAPTLLIYNSSEKTLIDSLCISADLTTSIVAEELFGEYVPDETSQQWPGPLPSPDTPAVILYTSGSTGYPKGVILSHSALCTSAELMTSHYQWSRDDRFLNLAGFHTMSGLRNSAIAPFVAGTLVVRTTTDERDSFFTIIESITYNRATLLGCAPIFIKQLSLFKDRIDPGHIKTLRAILCTGSILDPILVKEIYDHFNLPVINYYGLTETAGFCAGYSLANVTGSNGGIGFPVGSIMTVHNEFGQALPGGAVGELAVSSPNPMLGYYKEKELSDAALRNGQFYTGDIAKITETGEIILVGRKKNCIKNAHTELVYFEEVEMALEQHPQVDEAALCGDTNRLGCEQLVAFIVPHGTIPCKDDFVTELKIFLHERIGRHKVPQTIQLVASLPRNSTGKLLRQEVERLLHVS